MAVASPFPGMDPYLESHWRDVHHRLITYACDQLQDQLPGDLRARVEERVCMESTTGDSRDMYPDIRVIERPSGGELPTVAGSAVLAEPYCVELPEELITEGFIEIVDVGSGHRVVTVVEVLSLTNKAQGDGREEYLRKQRELKEGRVSLVEIDLLRGGQRSRRIIAAPRRTPYVVFVHRGWKPATLEVYPILLQQRLPAFRVPLRQSDADVYLDLQALIEQCYRRGRYDDINYRLDPDPPLDSGDAGWADQLLRAKGLR